LIYTLRSWSYLTSATVILLGVVASAGRTDDTAAGVAERINKKVVKLFGSGGYQGLAAFGTGVLVSPEGHILTVASPLLLTPELRVHLFDGRRCPAKVVIMEPELDAALIKIDQVEDLPFFDLAAATRAGQAKPGDSVLAFSNEFQIATRDEPVSVQHGVIAAYSRLHGRRGIFEAPYTGYVYVIDAIANNPGAGGGALTNRKGELLGIIGKELRNTLTDTWVNYAVPVGVLADFVEKAKKGEYRPVARSQPSGGQAGYHGIVLVPNVVERTPPFVEEVLPGSPAAKAGLRSDDLIVYLDGQQVASVRAFRELIEKVPPGTSVKLEVRRADKGNGGERLLSVDIRLDELPVKLKNASPKH
jgi:serine protease Do